MGKRSDPGSLVRDFIERIFEGYRYVVSQRSLLYSYLLQIVLNCSLTVVVVNIPVISKEVLRAPGDYGSALIVTPTILGSVIASYYVPRILEKGIRKLSIIYRSLVMMTFLLALITLIFPEIEGQTLRLVVYFGTFIALGACFVGTIIPLQTHIQEFSPEKMRGRILGNLWFLITLINIFPLLFSGIITEIFGVRVLLLLFFAIYLSIAIYIRNNSGIQLRDGVINNFRIS
jgi:MFS family permease